MDRVAPGPNRPPIRRGSSSVLCGSVVTTTEEKEMGAIPTEYAGIRFRSRLEATWAAFFDLLHWKWQYEPFDLSGYIPDFVIDFRKPSEKLSSFWQQGPLLIEVKPEASLVELAHHGHKIMASGWKAGAVVVGTGLRREVLLDRFDRPDEWPVIGHGLLWVDDDPELPSAQYPEFPSGFVDPEHPRPARLFQCACCRGISVYLGGYGGPDWCGICGEQVGLHTTEYKPVPPGGRIDADLGPTCWSAFSPPDLGLIDSLWATAKNRVQWRGEFGS